MIWFFNLEIANAGVCDNYNDLFQYFWKKEKVELDDKQSPEVFIADAADHYLKKQWCHKYCKVHKYVIIESAGTAMQFSS